MGIERVAVGGSCGGRQLQRVAVEVWGGCCEEMMQCGGVALGGNKVWGSCSMEEQCCGNGGVAVWGIVVWGDLF